MREIFVIEKMVVIGVWELASSVFFTDERVAIDVCLNIMKEAQKKDKNFSARVTKLNVQY